MSMILGRDGDPLVNWSLDPGKSMRIWWWGYGANFYNVGFPLPPQPFGDFNRIVAVNHGMENVDWPSHQGLIYTLDVRAEPSRNSYWSAWFLVQIGGLA